MSFQTPQYSLDELLTKPRTGALQLPDFQRPYRWNDERIRSLIVTILRGHPMGVLMTLRTGGTEGSSTHCKDNDSEVLPAG